MIQIVLKWWYNDFDNKNAYHTHNDEKYNNDNIEYDSNIFNRYKITPIATLWLKGKENEIKLWEWQIVMIKMMIVSRIMT